MPTCFDRVFFQLLKDGIAGRPQHIERLGVAYNVYGCLVPKTSGKSGGEEFHVGPHIMVVSPHPDELEGFNRDGSNGKSYVTHLHGTDQLFW
jgi:hypothetical protein